MTKAPDLREIIDPPDEVDEAAKNGDLVMFVGSGASMLLGLPSWRGLAAAAFEDLRKLDLLNFSEIEQLKTLDPKKQLSIAEQIAEDNGQNLDLQRHFLGFNESDSIYSFLNDIGCTCVTTNYDELLSPRFNEANDGSTASATGVRVSETKDFYANLLDDPGSVVHLHGSASKPETMIVTTRQYLLHYDNENVQEFLGELFARKTVVFIGYGLDEAEVLEHILRRGSATATIDKRRFAIQGFFRSQKPLYENLHRYYEKSFGVQLLGFLRDHKDYDCQVGIIESWSRSLKVARPPLAADAELMSEVFGGD